MTGQLCAVKVGRNEMLHWREVHAYALLSGQKGIAKYHWNDWMAEGCVLILDGLRANLAELSAVCPFNRDTEMTSHLAVETVCKKQIDLHNICSNKCEIDCKDTDGAFRWPGSWGY